MIGIRKCILVIVAVFFAARFFSSFSPALAQEEGMSAESQAAMENTVKLLSKIIEDAVQKSAEKAIELIPDAKSKSEEELNEIMDKTVREITSEMLKKENFEEAVIDAVAKCAQDAFKQGIDEALREEKSAGTP